MAESIRSIVISFEEYERLKNIEEQFESLQSGKNQGKVVFI
jgi:NADPH-dependent curcumin reductase CurA